MANPLICYPNWTLPTAVYTPTFTASGWIDISLLQGTVLSEMARYPGVNPANTKFVIDLGTTRNIRVLAAPFHNARLGDKMRMRLYADAGLTSLVMDSGWKEFFGVIYPYGSVPVTHPSAIDGRLTAEQAAGKTPLWRHIAPSEVLGRYLKVEADFSGNADGFVDIGQIVASPALTTTYNYSYGVKPPYYRDPSTARRAKGGPVFVDRQRPYRVVSLPFDWLSKTELYGPLYELTQEYGVSQPFLYIHDPEEDEVYLQKNSFFGQATRIGDPTHPRFGQYTMSIEIAEVF